LLFQDILTDAISAIQGRQLEQSFHEDHSLAARLGDKAINGMSIFKNMFLGKLLFSLSPFHHRDVTCHPSCMISSTTWSMTEMCRTHLKSERQDIDPDNTDTASYFDGSVGTISCSRLFVNRHCELDAHYQMAIASKVQILPLTRQLMNLAGNSWFVGLNCLSQSVFGAHLLGQEHDSQWRTKRVQFAARISSTEIHLSRQEMWGKKAALAVKQEADDDPHQPHRTLHRSLLGISPNTSLLVATSLTYSPRIQRRLRPSPDLVLIGISGNRRDNETQFAQAPDFGSTPSTART
jgi:hypothetical protein